MNELRDIPNERDLPAGRGDARRKHLMNEISTQTTGWHNTTYRRIISGVAAAALIATGGIVIGSQTNETNSPLAHAPTVTLDAKTLLAASKDAVSKNKIIHARTASVATQLKGNQTVHEEKNVEESWLNPVHTEEGRTRSYDSKGTLSEEWGSILLPGGKVRVVDVNYEEQTINDSIEKSLSDNSVDRSPITASAAKLFMDTGTGENAKVAGSETINGVKTTRVSGTSEDPFSNLSEDIWIANDTHFPIRKVLRVESVPSPDDENPYGATSAILVETTDYDVQPAPENPETVFLPVMPSGFTKSVDDASNY